MTTDHLCYHIYEDISIQYITLQRLFIFSFLCVHKKHKNANKRISYFFSFRCFLSAFFIFVRLFAFCAFAWLRLYAFLCFWCFSVPFCVFLYFFVLFCDVLCFFARAKSVRKKENKKFKTVLITSFKLLLIFFINLFHK